MNEHYVDAVAYLRDGGDGSLTLMNHRSWAFSVRQIPRRTNTGTQHLHPLGRTQMLSWREYQNLVCNSIPGLLTNAFCIADRQLFYGNCQCSQTLPITQNGLELKGRIDLKTDSGGQSRWAASSVRTKHNWRRSILTSGSGPSTRLHHDWVKKPCFQFAIQSHFNAQQYKTQRGCV